jgi:hypothetical protein
MRARNPCVRLRFKLLGWNVLFMTTLFSYEFNLTTVVIFFVSIHGPVLSAQIYSSLTNHLVSDSYALRGSARVSGLQRAQDSMNSSKECQIKRFIYKSYCCLLATTFVVSKCGKRMHCR